MRTPTNRTPKLQEQPERYSGQDRPGDLHRRAALDITHESVPPPSASIYCQPSILGIGLYSDLGLEVWITMVLGAFVEGFRGKRRLPAPHECCMSTQYLPKVVVPYS